LVTERFKVKAEKSGSNNEEKKKRFWQ